MVCGVQVVYAEQVELEVSRWCMVNCVVCGVQVVYAEQVELEVSRWCMVNCVVCGVQVVYAEQVELEVSTTKGAAGQRIPQAGQALSSVGQYSVMLRQRRQGGLWVVRSYIYCIN